MVRNQLPFARILMDNPLAALVQRLPPDDTREGGAVVVETLVRSSARHTGALSELLIGGMITLFAGVLLADLAYSSTYELQWKNFASWLLVGALVLCGFALLVTLIVFFRSGRRDRGSALLALLLLATWILGFIDALIHAKDAWASMPAATIVSIFTAVLALAAGWLGLSASPRNSQ